MAISILFFLQVLLRGSFTLGGSINEILTNSFQIRENYVSQALSLKSFKLRQLKYIFKHYIQTLKKKMSLRL